MANESKKQMSENSLKNLEKGKSFSANDAEFARECQKKSVAARLENKEKNIERNESAEYAWRKFFGTDQKLEDFWKSLSDKDKKDIFIRLLPPDKQTSEIMGNLGIEKVFVTPEEIKEVNKHIDDVINDAL